MKKEYWRHFRIYFFILLGISILATISRSLFLSAYNVIPIENINIPAAQRPLYIFISYTVGMGLLALVLSWIDVYILDRIIRKRPMGVVIFIGAVTQFLALISIYYIMDYAIHAELEQRLGIETQHISIRDISGMFVLLIAGMILSRLFIEIDKKLGPGNLWKMITGRFYKPREEEKLFMFFDLKDSTKIAEKIGHLQFSELLKNCFDDLAIVDKYGAAVYQYVGDEAVLTWDKEKALENNNYLKAFFAFCKKRDERAAYYRSKFGVVPFFKAGVHAGIVVTTEVGKLKSEISHHGDTINTAARVQDLCNDLEARLLISETVFKDTINRTAYRFEDKGLFSLKGKKREVKIFKVDEPI